MKIKFLFLAVLLMALSNSLDAQVISPQMEELTAPDFLKALEKSDSVCVIPIGVLEKHGPHLPLGTDLITSRDMVLRAVEKEYAVVFPPYFFSQIFEAKHQPGTIAYSPELIWNMLQETCDELGRNGFRKIVLVSGHGGNNNFLPFFCQTQLSKRKNYVVINYSAEPDPMYLKEIRRLHTSQLDSHAGQGETSVMMAIDPENVKTDLIKDQVAADQNRIEAIDCTYTGIWWYSKFPNHYASDYAVPKAELGVLLQKAEAERLAKVLKMVKENKSMLDLQNEFYNKAENPLKTEQ